MDLNFICHHLNVNLMVTPKKQPPQRSSKEHAEAVKEEVIKLKRAGEIKEVFYPEGLANTVVVKKSGKWRVCGDGVRVGWFRCGGGGSGSGAVVRGVGVGVRVGVGGSSHQW